MSRPLKRLSKKYEILDLLSEGEMGSIYKVRHRLLDETRVIKILRPNLDDDSDFRQRFLLEARTAIQLRHRNLAMLYDCTVDDRGYAYMALEYVEGVTLGELVDRETHPSVSLELELAQQALEAISYLHLKSIIHRDISPENLMFTLDDEGRPLVKLIDLGIAKSLEHETGVAKAGRIPGKLKYTAPELFSGGSKAADKRSDIYSLGVVLYELLTGYHPIAHVQPAAIVAAHLHERPRRFAETDPEDRLPKTLREVLLRALEKRPQKRFQSATQFLQAIKKLALTIPAYEPQEPHELMRTCGLSAAFQTVDAGAAVSPQQGPAPDADSAGVSSRKRPQGTPVMSSAAPDLARHLIEAQRALRANRWRRATELVMHVLQHQPDNTDALRIKTSIDEMNDRDTQHAVQEPNRSHSERRPVNLQHGDLPLPPLQLPLRWHGLSLPSIANEGFSLPEATFELTIETTFRVHRTHEMLALALVELFFCNNVVSLEGVEAWMDMTMRQQSPGVLQATTSCRPLDAELASPTRNERAELRRQTKTVMIRSLRSLKKMIVPFAKVGSCHDRREIGIRSTLHGTPAHNCGWLVPRSNGRFQRAEVFLRSSSQPITHGLTSIKDQSGLLTILHGHEVLTFVIDLEAVRSNWAH